MTEKLTHWQLTDFGLDHLVQKQSDLPRPGPSQVLVQVEAVSLNYRDLLLMRNAYGKPASLPLVPGSDLAGKIIAVGKDVQRWRGGESVISTFVTGWLDGAAPAHASSLGSPGPGVLASHVLLNEDWLVAAPTTLNAVQASTLPCAALTAWFGLVEEGGLLAGQSVLVHGTGGVALFGLQFARLHGAQAIVVSGSPDKHEKTLALGAHHVLARDSDWPAEVLRLTGGRGADHVLETVGGENLKRSVQALAYQGRIALIGVLAGGDLSASAFDTIRTRAVIQGISVGHRAALERMVRAIDLNQLKPPVGAEFGFASVPQAFESLQAGAWGKVVVRVAD